MITSPEYLAARAYHVAAHPLQTLDRINVNGADVLNGVMGIADQIRNKEYGALARGGGYVAGSVAQVYLLRKGAQKCGDWIDTKTYKPESFAKFMSPEDAKAYLKFLEQGSTSGLTDAELSQIKGTNHGLKYNLQFFAGENIEISTEGGSSVAQSEFNKLLNSDYYKTDFGYDCSEIAQDFYDVAGQKGKIYRIEGKSGYINGYEYNYKMEYVYHEVYSDGTYIYDPRYTSVPVLKDDYFRALREINPDGFDVFEIME